MSAPIVLLCSEVSYFVDDVRGTCADCGTAIVWRPHAPAPAVRLCLACVQVRLTADPEAPPFAISAEMRREAILFPRGTREPRTN